jgi:hypothetical protein
MSLKLKYAGFLMRHGINYWGPFLGAGIKVIDADKDMTKITVELRETWFNRNIVGVHFGGSLYAMCDPFFMGILLIYEVRAAYYSVDKFSSRKRSDGLRHAIINV